jgi:two-component system, chemotaxis family, response regulator Rcp1
MPAEAPSVVSEILLLEENPDDIELIREAVRDNHLNVVGACADVLCFLNRQGPFTGAPRPDLIILDLEMGDREDCAMLSHIKKDPVLKRIPVVVLASSDAHDNIFQAYDLHANAYLFKPQDRDQYIRMIRATLNFWLNLVRLPRT